MTQKMVRMPSGDTLSLDAFRPTGLRYGSYRQIPPQSILDRVGAELVDAPMYRTPEEARLVMVAWIDNLTSRVLSRYPASVRIRWSEEEAAARAMEAGTATPQQAATIAREAAAAGSTVDEHVSVIITNADTFRAIASEINTLMLATNDAINAAQDPFEYEGILDAAREAAVPLAARYGLIGPELETPVINQPELQ